MCGIAGFIGSGDEKMLRDMAGTVRHRGPDDIGFYHKDSVGLAHTRLSVIDLSSRGHQPMWNEGDNVAVVFNGEIYNFKELKKEFDLENKYSFRSETDTEVILRLYEEMGDRCFEKLDGMFAIAIYDAKDGRLFLARDRMGEKPLYWGLFGGTFIFGSELNAVLAHKAARRELNPRVFAEYLVREYVPTPDSIFKNIFKLEPASFLVYKGGKVTKKSFWSIPSETKETPFREALADFDKVLEKSVSNRLTADVPVGVFLSGGIDSSTVAYYAQKVSVGKIKTFSIGFDEESFDESGFAREVADFLSTDHYHKKVSARDSLDVINEIASVSGEPYADPSIIPTLILSKFTRDKVTVALGGDGMDELLAGYPTFQADKLISIYASLPKVLRKKIIGPVISSLPASDKNFSLSFKLQKFLEGESFPSLERHGRWLQAFSREELKDLLSPGHYEQVKDLYPYYGAGDKDDITSPQEVLNAYARSYLMDDVLVKLDRASMRYALEARAPFLGKEFVEFVSALPYEYKLRGFTTKYLLKKLMKDKLPERILRRTKKGFGVPVSEWLKKELRPLAEELFSEKELARTGIFNKDYVAKIFGEHLSGRKNYRKKLWTLLMFQLWAREYL